MNMALRAQKTRESFVRKHRTFFVGLFVLVPMAVVAALLLYTLMKSEVLQTWIPLHVFYDQNPGLAKGNGVNISGIPIGRVQKVNLVKEGCIEVVFRIDGRFQNFVKKDARAMLNQKNFPVGDWEIRLTGGSDSVAAVTGGDTLAADYSLRIDKIAAQATGIMGQADTIVGRIARGEGTVGKILAEDTLLMQIQGILRNINTITMQASRMMKKADTMLAFMNRVGAAGVILTDSVATIMATAQQSLADARIIMKDVKTVSADFRPMMSQVQDNLDRAETMMRGLQKNWIMKKMAGKPEDRMLKDEP